MIRIKMRFLNLLGRMKGYSGCPNCDDSWYWKEDSSLETSPNGGGVMICKECLSKPEILDVVKIERSLSDYNWKSRDIILVLKAVNDFKKKGEANANVGPKKVRQ